MRKWTRVGFQPNLPLEEKRRVTECKEHIRLSKEAAKEGMVLLKNEKAFASCRRNQTCTVWKRKF